MPIYEPKREADVFRNVTGSQSRPAYLRRREEHFERIIDEMRTLQRMRREQKKTGRERMLVVMQQGRATSKFRP